jgi:hypothetical protein
MARSENSWEVALRDKSKLLGKNISFENQIFDKPDLKSFLKSRQDKLRDVLDEIDALEGAKDKHIAKAPPKTCMIPDLETKTMVERPAPVDYHISYDEELGKWLTSDFVDKLNRANAMSTVLQCELYEGRKMLNN